MRSFLSLSLTLACVLLLLPAPVSHAQFASPNVNGTIAANEYGAHADGQNQQSTDTQQTWYMTWDDANLYVAVTNANLGEAAILYIDRNPVTPANGGTNTDGNLTGNAYDNTNFAALPFRADFVSYVKRDYREFRTANGAGGWSDGTANFGSYASGAGDVREFSIPWSAVTNGNGRPASFNFFGYLTSPGGFVFGQVPNDNPNATIGTSATYTKYYRVTSTANGSSTKPFAQKETSGSAPTGIDARALRHDTFDNYYRSPFGATPAGTSVTLRLRTAHTNVEGVALRVYQYDTATDTTANAVDYPLTFLENRTEGGTLYDVWSITLPTPIKPAILYYKFRVTSGVSSAFYSDAYADDHDNLNQGGEGEASNTEPFPAFQITVYEPNFQTPAWLQNANVYQIFPDRFRNGDITNDYCRPGTTTGCPNIYGNNPVIARETWNATIFDPRQPGQFQNSYGTQYYGGDLKGIENQLDYLQSIGIDAIYLNPIFKARSNHRYDTDNFLEVDPALGGDAAFDSLKTAMERRGMRLILDAVFNHASSDGFYFDRFHRYNAPPEGACESAASPYRSWFEFRNSNAPCTSSDYEGWFGFDSLPAFKDDNAEVRDFFFRNPTNNVTKYWLDRGAAGWRFDVATDISHNWWREYRPLAKSYKSDAPLIGENFPDASSYLAGDQLDSVMNYRFRKNILGFARAADFSDNDNNNSNRIIALTPSGFDRALRSVREDYPEQATRAMLNLIDSHDTNRALYVLTRDGDTGLAQAKERLRLTALFQYTYTGAPMTYYGNEGALDSPPLASGVNGTEDDPYNRAPYPWADEQGDPNIYGPIDNALVTYYSTLARLRKQHDALRNGTFETLLTGDTTAANTDDNTFAFARRTTNETAIVALNNGTNTNQVAVPVAAYFSDGTQLQDALSGQTFTVNGGTVNVTLAPRGGIILFAGNAVVDAIAPTASVTVNPTPNAAGWNNTTPVTVNLNGADTNSGIRELRYYINDGNTTSVAGNTTLTLTDEGVTTVNLRAIDNAGNISPLTSVTVRIDKTAPVTASSITRNGSQAIVTLTANDNSSGISLTTYSINGGAAQTYTSPFTVAEKGTLTFRSIDVAGNTESVKTVSLRRSRFVGRGRRS